MDDLKVLHSGQAVQSNFAILDMLYGGHLVIADTISQNRPNHGETLTKNLYIADTL